jgi:hypothetical protein
VAIDTIPLATFDGLIMDSVKLAIISWVANEKDPQTLKRLHELVTDIEYERASDTKVIGFRMNGTKIYKSRFIQGIRQSEAGVENGELLSIDDLEKQSENW